MQYISFVWGGLQRDILELCHLALSWILETREACLYYFLPAQSDL